MGSTSSKAARTAVGAVTRKYPTRSPTAPPPTSSTTSAHSSPLAADAHGRDGPTVHTRAQPSNIRNEAVENDARDPDFAASLRKLGPVQPFPTFSPSSISSPQASDTRVTASSSFGANTTRSNAQSQPLNSYTAPTGGGVFPNDGSGIYPSPANNPAIAILEARSRIAEEYEEEKLGIGKRNFEGRKFMDVATIRKALVLRDEQGMDVAEIERTLGLRKGVVGALGRQGVVEVA